MAKTSKAVVKWTDEFKDLAVQSAKGAKVSEGKFISFGGGKMSFGGAEIPDGELRCVVVGWIHANAYYDPDVRYDPKTPQSPICYAFGVEEEEMVPHKDAPDKQNPDCATCPFNEFESAKQGKGKACKNMIRLALIAESDLDNLENAEVVYASLPPKSLKNWLAYAAKTCAKALERPHWSVITLMTRVPDDESQFRVTFKMEELIEDQDKFGPLKELWEKTMGEMDFPYAPTEAPVVAPKKANKAQKFARR